VNINGANRLGSNSLTELLVFGREAGKSAARFAAEQPGIDEKEVEAQRSAEEKRLTDLFGGGDERVADLRTELQLAMEHGAGIYRTEKSLMETIEKIAELKERYRRVHLDDSSRTFNTEWVAAVELGYLLDYGEALSAAALARTESRGAHQRLDHPARDDGKFLAHSLAYFEEGGPPRIEFSPVTITKWPPGKREYGAKSGLKRDTGEKKDEAKDE
jgi:fumarate reductase flavoprotein subunit